MFDERFHGHLLSQAKAGVRFLPTDSSRAPAARPFRAALRSESPAAAATSSRSPVPPRYRNRACSYAYRNARAAPAVESDRANPMIPIVRIHVGPSATSTPGARPAREAARRRSGAVGETTVNRLNSPSGESIFLTKPRSSV